MSLALDVTGVSGANLVSNEAHTINTIRDRVPYYLLLVNSLFYENNLSIVYTDVNGSTKTLSSAEDYDFNFTCKGVVAGNDIHAALVFTNNKLNGTLAITYQAVGGAWIINNKSFSDVLNNTVYNPRLSYLGLSLMFPLYPNGSTSPMELNSALALQYANAQNPLGSELLPAVMMLPESKQILSGGQGVVLNADDELLNAGAGGVAFTPSVAGGPGVVTSAATDYKILPFKSERKFLSFSNTHASAVIRLNIRGVPAYLGGTYSGIPVAAGATILLDHVVPNSEIHVASITAGATYDITEG